MGWADDALQRASERGRIGQEGSDMSNTQRVAIITGASQGIGEGLVSAYRKLGYAVVANSRTITESDDAMVLTVPGDIARPGVGQRIVDAALDRFGRVDTVVNNAGIFIAKPFTDYTDDDYDAVTGVNLRGFFELSRAAVAAMLSGDGGGHLVNISTSLVDHANSQVPSALASLTKGGLNAVTKALAIEYAGRGIRANAVALGVIRTPMHDPASYDALAKLHPVGRLGEIDDIVDAILYLENAPFVTGEILHVDGGQSAGH
jgi:NAD(P)-dependent dehydrogenase (short-subunit alcohol dehydrogenase family)